jgi:hypothetical protein
MRKVRHSEWRVLSKAPHLVGSSTFFIINMSPGMTSEKLGTVQSESVEAPTQNF